MLEQEIREPAKAAVIAVALNQDGTLRFCADDRRLYALVQRDAHLIPGMEECNDFFGQATFFSILDVNSRYGHVDIDHRDKKKTGFLSTHSLYRFTGMQFELKECGWHILTSHGCNSSFVRWKTAFVYLYDIAIFFRTPEEHTDHYMLLLTLL